MAYGLAHRDLEGVTHIGIDEISRKRGHVYVTNVYDLQDKRLLWSGEGRSKATLEAFFEFLGLRIPVKPITESGVKPITESGQVDHLSERSDAGVRLCRSVIGLGQ